MARWLLRERYTGCEEDGTLRVARGNGLSALKVKRKDDRLLALTPHTSTDEEEEMPVAGTRMMTCGAPTRC